MPALAVALVVTLALYVWLDVYPLLARLVVLRERRLDADLATEARKRVAEERATRDLRAAALPDDLETLARQWAEGGDGDAGDSVRARARELFALLREDAGSDRECWDRVRTALVAESEHGAPVMEVLP